MWHEEVCPGWPRARLGAIEAGRGGPRVLSLRPFPSSVFLPGKEITLELPTHHRVPLGWLIEHGGPAIALRTLKELSPHPSETDVAAAEAALGEYKPAASVVAKQRSDGTWGGNLLGLAPSASQGIKDIGTVPQYRRLLEMGWSRDDRAFKLGNRLLFRLLSRDPDPELLFEHRAAVKAVPDAEHWVRAMYREAVAAALAEYGFAQDPRLRGAAHRIATDVSHYLRSGLAEKPFVKSGSQTVLNPEAYPPTWYSVAMVAAMPTFQRERAGFTDRLGQYLAHAAPKKSFVVKVGRKSFKTNHILLGNPIAADGKGVPADLPLALYYIELLARIGALHTAPVATKVLARLVKDCDENGIWHPKNLRSQPKAGDRITYHYYPLLPSGKAAETRQADVTFRLALIAHLLGWDLEFLP